MSRYRTVLGVFGVAAVGFGVGLAFAPDLFLAGPVPDLTDRLAETGAVTVMLGAGVTAGLLALVATRSNDDPSVTARTADPLGGAVGFETGPDGPTEPPGPAVETAIEDGGEAWERVRAQLVETAVEVHASTAGVRRDRAERAVARGDWTDDPLAAGVTAGDMSLVARVRLWAVPRRERRRQVERTIAALERSWER